MTALRIAIFHNNDDGLASGEPKDVLAARDVLDAAAAVAEACRKNGWEPLPIVAASDPRQIVDSLLEARVDVVFNLVEALGGEARFEAAVAWLFEMVRVPYTGSSPVALSIGLDKPLTKSLLSSRSIPVPRGIVVERGDESLEGLPYPVIVKPSREDASHGITLESIADHEEAARERARYVLRQYRQPALVEEFVEGREFNVSVLGQGDSARTLPFGEVDFSAFPEGKPRIVSYEAKWVSESVEFQGTTTIAARDLDSSSHDAIEQAALGAYRAIGLRDYGRVDIRFSPRTGPKVLEVNPNPCLSPDAGIGSAGRRAGIAYEALIATIVTSALDRARHLCASPGDPRMARAALEALTT